MNNDSLRTKLEEEVAHYLASGESDPLGGSFPGAHALERITGFERHLRQALLHEVQRREKGRRQTRVPEDLDSPAGFDSPDPFASADSVAAAFLPASAELPERP